MIWTADALIKATGGTYHGDEAWAHSGAINGIEFDSRKISPGDLFLALPGETHDGHDFAEAAATAGAVAMVGCRKASSGLPTIVVEDSLAALNRMAATARDRSSAFRVAVTGSVGKTGTKELITKALAAYGPCHATAGNFNNHIGAPLTLARMPSDTQFGVFELGMNHAGELAALSPLVMPHAAVITRIAASHIGHFGSLDDIAEAKAEIFTGLTPGGLAIINADDDYAPLLTARARQAGAEQIITVGTTQDASHRILTIDRQESGLAIAADCGGEQVHFNLSLMAPHWAYAAVISLALIQLHEKDLSPGCDALSRVADLPGRGRRHRVKTADGCRFTLIDESYNASPASVMAALEALSTDPHQGRRVVILGDMLELGNKADQLHLDLADSITSAGPDTLICFGPHMIKLAASLEGQIPQIITAQDAETAAQSALQHMADGDLVLVKGSNGMKTAQVVSSLLAKSASPDGESHAA